MGGHEGGDVASQLAVRAIARRTVNDVLAPALAGHDISAMDYQVWLRDVVQEANRAVFERRKASNNDMGTTLVMAIITGAPELGLQATIAHVGDSRAYLISGGAITRLTTDHSLVERLVATGQIQPEEAATHPQRNVIYRSVGDRPQVEADVTTQALSAGDILLLCCDGLNGEISDEEMLRIVLDSASLPEASRWLIDAANDAGGSDNISVILVGVRSVDQ
jgi:protein phosphatase